MDCGRIHCSVTDSLITLRKLAAGAVPVNAQRRARARHQNLGLSASCLGMALAKKSLQLQRGLTYNAPPKPQLNCAFREPQFNKCVGPIAFNLSV